MKAYRTLRTVLSVAAATTLCAAVCAEPWQVQLREEATVRGKLITLADVARLADGVPAEAGGTVLGSAPWPGQLRRISPAMIAARLVSGGYASDQFLLTGSEGCLVQLDSLRIEPERLVDCARRALLERFPEGGPEVQVELLREPGPAMVAAGDPAPELRATVNPGAAPGGRVRVDVDVVRDGERLAREPVMFLVRIYDTVAVARQQLAPGEGFSDANVALVRREVTAEQDRCMRSQDELHGKVAARTIAPGQTLTVRNVRQAERPVVIERDQRIFLLVETPTLRVMTLGVALERARLGETARARNLASGREVVGLAAAEGVVRVPLGGPGNDE